MHKGHERNAHRGSAFHCANFSRWRVPHPKHNISLLWASIVKGRSQCALQRAKGRRQPMPRAVPVLRRSLSIRCDTFLLGQCTEDLTDRTQDSASVLPIADSFGTACGRRPPSGKLLKQIVSNRVMCHGHSPPLWGQQHGRGDESIDPPHPPLGGPLHGRGYMHLFVAPLSGGPKIPWSPSLAGRSLTKKKKRSVPVPRFPKNAHGHTMCWRLAVGGWRLAVGGWWRLVVGNWWLMAVSSGWRLVAAGGWRLVAVGG